MPMNPRLLRPIASGVHPEAAAWRSAVVGNGGSVSASTMKAVSKFCADIDAAGIRDRFYRLNLFCGTGLSACLVPLYRGASLGGTQYGNTTDTNNGPFVSGDYAENVGLSKAVSTTKHLDTGLATSALPAGVISSGHLSAAHGPLTQGGDSDPTLIGAHNGATERKSLSQSFRSATAGNEQGRWGKTVNVAATDGAVGLSKPSAFLLVQRTSATNLELWRNNSLVATNTTSATGIAGITFSMLVFGLNASGTHSGVDALNMRHYSIGDDMTSAQIGAFYTALQTFNTALGRTA